MRTIIPAVGMGNRPGKYTKNNTEYMLPVNGKMPAERAPDAPREAGKR